MKSQLTLQAVYQQSGTIFYIFFYYYSIINLVLNW